MTLTASDIANYSAKEKHLHEEIGRTFPFRDSGKKELYQAWSKACDAWHRHRSPLDHLWTEKFRADVKKGDRKAINELITFLEVDPYYFRSGYLKGRLARYIKSAPRTESDNRRLRAVIWNRCGRFARQEFREYCRLATLISTPSFREEIYRQTKLAHSNNFKFLLPYLS